MELIMFGIALLFTQFVLLALAMFTEHE